MSSYMDRPPTSWVIYPPYPENEAGKKKPKPSAKSKAAKQAADQPPARRAKSPKSTKKPS